MNAAITRFSACLLLTPALALGACSAADAPTDEPLDSEAESIIKGTLLSNNYNAVALYHRTYQICNPSASDAPFTRSYRTHGEWWPRPCSGFVIRNEGNVRHILTARHCVTDDGEIAGPIVVGDGSITAISTLNPGVIIPAREEDGVLIVNRSPPAQSLAASVLYQDLMQFGDLALVKAVGDLLPPSSAVRPGFVQMSPGLESQFVGTSITSYGYGRNTAGHCYNHASSGAGQLRAANFRVDTVTAGTFTHEGTNGTGQSLTHGDSGGPLLTVQGSANGPLYRVFGTNTSTTAAGGPVLTDFLQAYYGSLFLVDEPSLLSGTVVGADVALKTAFVYRSRTGNNERTRIRVDRGSGKLKINGWCINDLGANAKVQLGDCNSASSTWRFYPNAVIKNANDSRCLAYDSTNALTTVTCPATPVRWLFTVDSNR